MELNLILIIINIFNIFNDIFVPWYLMAITTISLKKLKLSEMNSSAAMTGQFVIFNSRRFCSIS